MTTKGIFYGKQLSAAQYEALMAVFSRNGSHAEKLSQYIGANLRLSEVNQDKKGRSHTDVTRIVDLGAGPGVCLGSILKSAGLVREVGATAVRTPPSLLDARNKTVEMIMPGRTPCNDEQTAELSVWCVDPFFYKNAPRLGVPGGSDGGGGNDEWTLPTDVDGRRLEVVGGGRVHFVSANAVEFLTECRERVGLMDRILMKEVVHHVNDLEALCQGLHRVLRPGTGLALIAGRTFSKDVPWFPQAAKLFDESCMDVELICKHVRDVVGLSASITESTFDVHINLASWCTLLRNRFWSHLSTISDDEMEQGISEVRKMYNDDDATPVVFPDRFTFIHICSDENADAGVAL